MAGRQGDGAYRLIDEHLIQTDAATRSTNPFALGRRSLWALLARPEPRYAPRHLARLCPVEAIHLKSPMPSAFFEPQLCHEHSGLWTWQLIACQMSAQPTQSAGTNMGLGSRHCHGSTMVTAALHMSRQMSDLSCSMSEAIPNPSCCLSSELCNVCRLCATGASVHD